MRTERIDAEDGSGYSLYHYDDDYNELKVEDFDPDGTITMVIDRTYDERGCTGWTVRGREGELIKRFEVVFDADGNEVLTRQYDSAGRLEEEFSEDELGTDV